MAGLPKKYARMGFAKGWKAYRSRSHTSHSRTYRASKVATMARRRKGSFKRRLSGFARKSARRGGVGNSAALLQVDAMVYGASRAFISDKLQPITNKIPLGTLSDELVMGGLCYFIAKKAGKGMLGNVARKGLVIENARVGEALVQGGLGVLTGNSTSSGGVVYM